MKLKIPKMTIMLVALMIMACSSAAFAFFKYQSAKKALVNVQSVAITPTETPFPTQAEPTVTVSQVKQVQGANTYVPPTQSDVVDCTIQNIGTVKMKRSECQISFACEINSGHWYVYTSRDKCLNDQKNAAGAGAVPTTSYQYTNTYTPSTNTDPVKIDCTVGGKVIGNMTYADCLQKSNEYKAQVDQDYQNAMNEFKAKDEQYDANRDRDKARANGIL